MSKQAAFDAIRNHDLAGLQAIVAESPRVLLGTNARRDSLLHQAAEYGDTAMLAFLTGSGMEVNVNRVGVDAGVCHTPLHVAAGGGRLEVLRWLIEHGANLEAGSGHCATPLLQAAMAGKLEAVQALLAAGADAHARYFVGAGNHRQEFDAITLARIKGHGEVVALLEGLG